MFAVLGNLHQCPGDAVGITGELHRRCIGKKFSLAAHRGLDQVAEKGAYESYDNQANAQKDNAPGVFGAAAVHAAQHQVITNQPQHHDAVQHADQADIDAHVAVQDVAEFMGDNTLQLFPAEGFDSAAGYRDDGIAGRVAGGEGIDAVLFHQVDRRHRDAGGDSHLFDYVEHPPLIQILRTGQQQPAVHHLRDTGAAASQARNLVEAAQEHDPGNGGADQPEGAPIEAHGVDRRRAGRFGAGETKQKHHQQVGDDDQ